jgi:hypothetical protein
MDIFEFLQKSEWPILVGGVILYFRKPLTGLVAGLHLTKFNAWGLTAEFEKRLDKVEALTEPTRQITQDEAPKQVGHARTTDKAYIGPETKSPQYIILRSWSRLEALLRGESEARVGKILTSPRRIEERARLIGLTDDEIDALLELRKMRNQIAHSIEFNVSLQDAARFANVAESLRQRIEALAKNK